MLNFYNIFLKLLIIERCNGKITDSFSYIILLSRYTIIIINVISKRGGFVWIIIVIEIIKITTIR